MTPLCVFFAVLVATATRTGPEIANRYLAAVRSGVIRATGRVVSLRRRTAVVQVEVDNEDGDERRTIALAQGTISLNAPREQLTGEG